MKKIIVITLFPLLSSFYMNGQEVELVGKLSEERVKFSEQGSIVNLAFIQQVEGNRNVAVIEQRGRGNVTSITQVGNSNTAELTQVGSNNFIKSTSLGNNNDVEVEQVGDGNVYTNVRIGKGSNGAKNIVQQQGNGHKAVQIQYDGSSGVVIQQRGNALSQPVVVKTGRIGSF